MCGLVGMIGDAISTDLKALKVLLTLDVLRGEDSTGLAVVDKKTDEVNVYKQIGAPHYLFDGNKEFDMRGVWCGAPSKVFIGHNRAATKGKITSENAHPFQHGDIVGAHNGTLTSVRHLEDGYKFEVDSEAIFYNLNMYKTEDIIGSLEGAYALTWYDSADNKMYIIRNSQRPLYWCRRTDGDVIYWASEKWMLMVALERQGIKFTDPQAFDINTLYSFDMSDFTRFNFRKRNWVQQSGVYGYLPVTTNSTVKGGEANKSNPFPPSQVAAAMGHGSNFSNISSEELAKLKKLEDETIEFRMGDVKYGQGKVPYIAAYPSSFKEDYDIRIFSHNHKSHKEWTNKKHGPIFTGKVKRFVNNFVNGKREAYVLIDLRSIEEKKAKEEHRTNVDMARSEFYMGYNGRFLTVDELHTCAQRGCAGCGDPITPDEMYLFVTDDEFLCHNCQKSGQYDQYFLGIHDQRHIQQIGLVF